MSRSQQKLTPIQIQAQARLTALERKKIREKEATPVWEPQSGPQTEAFNSTAQVIGYGGAAGGGKSDIALGLAGRKHQRSIIFRRVFPSCRGLIDRSKELFSDRAVYNEAIYRWIFQSDGRSISFASLPHEDDKNKFQGRPYDLYVFDEATEFTEGQVRFVTAWNRSTHRLPDGSPQPCQVLLTFNPPMTSEGQWVIKYFGPWLDRKHPNPAKDGELRYFTAVGGEEKECAEEDLFWYYTWENQVVRVETNDLVPLEDGRLLRPQRGLTIDGVFYPARSRTFFHASLKDNPIMEATGYGADIELLPEPLRSYLKGSFDVALGEEMNQVIPTAWVQLAQERWRKGQRPNVPLSQVGLDVAHGGKDKTTMGFRYGNWLEPIVAVPGVKTPTSQASANLVWELARIGMNHYKPENNDEEQKHPTLVVDCIGYGAGTSDRLQEMAEAERQSHGVSYHVIPLNVSGKTAARDRSRKYGFINIRSMIYWKLREALDPESGLDICLPDDPELLSDLCSATYEVKIDKIKVEDKASIKKRIGRSPDKGDCTLLAFYAHDRKVMWGTI